ncbi:MAG: RNA polymerase sigma factor [Bdellovibrionales bacterium]
MKTDLELIQEVKNGMHASFEALVHRHQKFLLKVVVRMTRDLNVAEDVVQEAFIKAYRRLGLFEGRSSFRSWLYQIAINTARNRFRRQHRESIGTDSLEISVESSSEAELMATDVRAVIQSEVDRLPDRQREALSLRVFEDLSFKEIADIMKCPYDTAKANYRHALLKLKERLKNNQSLRGWVGPHRMSFLELATQSMEVES